VTDDPRIQQLLDQLLDEHATPEIVCATCPELLTVVRDRWQQMRRLRADLDALFPPQDETAPQLAEGTALPQIPGYKVEAVLGRGGMGVVFKARHLKLNRLVALKMMLAGTYAFPEELGRFRREAEAVAVLRHPNIVQVHDAGEVAGRPYFTMEYVEGGTLAHSLSANPLSPRRAAELLATLASAVHFAHKSGFVHRDLKPANILLTPDGTPRITDFGLVRSIDAGPEFTRSGALIGTPSYMAPEQAMGRASAVGPAVDIHALGSVLYEMLTGRPPFEGRSACETLQQVVSEEPTPLSRLNAQVPRDLETICLKCLQKSPARRYASAQDLADDLYRFLDGKPVLARPVGMLERAVKWVRRRPAAALLVGALVVALGAVIGAGVWLQQQAADQQAARAQREQRAREAVEATLRRVEDLRREERWQDALHAMRLTSTRLVEANSPLLEEKLRQAQSDCQIAADLQNVRENYPLLPDGTIDYAQRAKAFLKAFEQAGLRIDEDPETVAARIRDSTIREQLIAALDDRAVVASYLRDKPLAERFSRIARLADEGSPWKDRFRDPANWRSEQLQELAATAFTTSPPPSEHQLALLALLLRSRGAAGRSAHLLGEACRHQPRNFWVHLEMGSVLYHLNQNLEAAGYYRVALSLRPENASAHEGLAMCLSRLGQTEDAIAAYRRAVEVAPHNSTTRTRLVGELAKTGYWKEADVECRRALNADPGNYLALLQLASPLLRHHRYEEALLVSRKAAEIAPNAAAAQLALADSCAQLARHEEAATAYRRVLEIKSPFYPIDEKLAKELTAAGRWEEAISVLQAGAVRSPPNSLLYVPIGEIFLSRGKPQEATEAFRKVTIRTPAALEGLAVALLAQGQFAEARAVIESRLKQFATDEVRRELRRRLDLCNVLAAVETKLPAILAGEERPTDVPTQRALAEWCLKHKRLPGTAAGFYASALATQPSLAEDQEAGNRYHAACAAALAVRAADKDVAELDAEQRAALRKRALDWLTAEYDACTERHRLGKPGDRTVAATAARSWIQSEDLVAVRDEQALAKLPAEERQAWEALWTKIGTLATRDPTAKFDQARKHVARMEWEKAAACYAEGMELEQTDQAELWFEYAAAQLLAGDRVGYRRTCAHMVACCQSAGPMRPYLVARACTLAPDSTDDPKQPLRLFGNELARNVAEYWACTEQGGLLFRARLPKDSVRFLENSLAADGRPSRAVLNWLWLALSRQKTGSPIEARRLLDKAANWLDQQGGRMPLDDSFMGSQLHNWLEAHVLRQEADALLR
jgi:serine/threonine-protein kinase